LLADVRLPDAASAGRTRETVAFIDRILRGDPGDPERFPGVPGVGHTLAITGQSLLLNANAPNFGSIQVVLKPFEERRGVGLSGPEIADRIRAECRKHVRDAKVSVFAPPPVDGLGTAGGFKLVIEDRGPTGPATLQKAADAVVAAGDEKVVSGLFTSARAETPWLYLKIDRDKCLSLGVPLGEVFNTLQVYLGSYYVNNFNEFGRTWQVNIQADPRFRSRVEDIPLLKVRNLKGEMVPLGTLAEVRDSTGPVLLTRYNMYSAAAIYGSPAPGTSSGQAVAAMRKACDKALPNQMAYEWTELTYLQLQAGNSAMYVFALAVVFVFLVLAAQYESWTLPLAVILVVPMCLLCAAVGLNLRGADINIFPQIGFVVLVGLASKNAILIVEFAKQQHEEGKPPFAATVEACRLRLRPILMTSFAFILGVLPLVIATGAGAEMRRSLGLAVFAGMLGVTFFGIFLTPVFFFVIQWLTDCFWPTPPPAPPAHG
jgi:multidrug efflux pump subunit AcrB